MRCVIRAIKVRAHARIDRVAALSTDYPRDGIRAGATGSDRHVRFGEDRGR
jgi:hypothetical protein